jgi:hypothetical protein
MKMQNITRLLVTRLRGEHHADNSLAQRQLVASKASKTPKAQTAAELASFRRNISKLSTRQLQQLHSRLSKRLGSLALAKMMKEAKR